MKSSLSASKQISAASAAESPNSASHAFTVRNLKRYYHLEHHDIQVLENVTFEVQAGEWLSLVGRSGSGKTTILHLLGALDKPTAGEITCQGRSYRDLSGRQQSRLRRDHIGFVFQSYHLFPELTALENVLLPALQYRWNRLSVRDRATELLASFGLQERLRHRPQELSGGEQQRVALARALINDPDILLADEPTGNLDVKASHDILELLAELHREQKKTIVMVTHDLQMAELADRILLIKNGSAVPYTEAEKSELEA